jgi:hypothetical protein
VGKLRRLAVRAALIAVLGSAMPAVLGSGVAHAAPICGTPTWSTIRTGSPVTSAPYTLTIRLQAQKDPRTGEVCTDYFRTAATVTASTTNGAGGTLTAVLTANSVTRGSRAVPTGAQGSWTAYAYGRSNVFCVTGSGTFRSMSANAARTCVN